MIKMLLRFLLMLISSNLALGNYTLTREDLIQVCERTRLLINSGVEPEKAEKIVANDFLHKDVATAYQDDELDYNITESDYVSGSVMSATMEGYINSLVQIITKFIVAENINIYISYADNLIVNVFGKREIPMERRLKMQEKDVCREVDFPSKLDMNNGKEVSKALLRLSMEAMDHINKFFKDTIEKLTNTSQ